MLVELLILLGLTKTKHVINSLSMSSKPDEFGTFIDGNGDLRIMPSLRQVYYGYTKTGERVIKDRKTGSVVINVDYERAKKNEEEARANGDNFYLRSSGGGKGLHKLGNADIDGARYCKVDGNPNDFYVKRCINYTDVNTNTSCNGFFYMDMNYNLVSPSDELKKLHHNDKDFIPICSNIMTEVNNSKRKYLMRNDKVMYVGKSSGYKYDHASLRTLR